MNLIVSMLAAAAMVAPATPVMAQDGVLLLMLEATSKTMVDRGFKPTGWTEQGTLASGGSTTVKVTLDGGSHYILAGVCGSGCEDLNLVIRDAAGAKVDQDVADDPLAILMVDKSGSYSVTVDMKTCTSDSCQFAVRSFAQ